MSTLINLFFLLFFTIVQCQNLMNNPFDSNVKICSCDLNKGSCDISCCCDTDCSVDDIKSFDCNSKINENTNKISSKPIVQSTCFKDIPIFKSNSPHIIQKRDDMICVDHERNVDITSGYYEKMINQGINSSVLPRSMNIDNSVSLPSGTEVNLTDNQVGSSVFRFIRTANRAIYYSLPVKIFNNPTCAGYQPITYLNDFTSTCAQPVTQQACVDVLNPLMYNSICLVTDISTLAIGSVSSICCTAAGSSSNWNSPTCSGALQSFTLTIYYSNPNGIVSCNITLGGTTSSSTTVEQTFTVLFVQNGSSTSNTVRSGNPGYLPGSLIIAGNANGNSITEIPSLTILQASATGACSGGNPKSIRFGRNVQSTCLFSPITSGSCPNASDLTNIFMSYTFTNLYVAAEGNPDTTNITGSWLPVTYCTSEIGSTDKPTCRTGTVPSLSAGQCYTRLDVQIAYGNIGAVTNPQPIIGAVVFHFQTISSTSATSLLMTQTVTFQDISNSPATEGDLVPSPNTRLPGDFFYPFTLNRATNSVTFSSVFYLLVIFLNIFM